ncbi:phage regulatory CII family protein [Muricoccus vinaceus]|uniref:Phage regulatory CII family protein n=1 Tax=Muricoccus vinaceus TaxID=424704 RepID=A0ABV6IL70_9PROT
MTKSDPYAGLKSLFQALCQRVGGLDAAAACTRVRRAQLGNYGNLNMPEIFAPVDVVLELQAITKDPIVTAEMARLQGYALVPVEAVAEGELAALLAKVGAESGAVFQEFAQALGNDGQVDSAERTAIARKLSDLLRVTHAALGYCHPRPAPVPAGDRGAA